MAKKVKKDKVIEGGTFTSPNRPESAGESSAGKKSKQAKKP